MKGYLTIRINKEVLKVIGIILFWILVPIVLGIVVSACVNEWTGITYQKGYETGRNQLAKTIINANSSWINDVTITDGISSRIIYLECPVKQNNSLPNTTSQEKTYFSNKSINAGTLKLGVLPEPKDFGFVCLGNYTAKINETFIGCTKK